MMYKLILMNSLMLDPPHTSSCTHNALYEQHSSNSIKPPLPRSTPTSVVSLYCVCSWCVCIMHAWMTLSAFTLLTWTVGTVHMWKLCRSVEAQARNASTGPCGTLQHPINLYSTRLYIYRL